MKKVSTRFAEMTKKTGADEKTLGYKIGPAVKREKVLSGHSGSVYKINEHLIKGEK